MGPQAEWQWQEPAEDLHTGAGPAAREAIDTGPRLQNAGVGWLAVTFMVALGVWIFLRTPTALVLAPLAAVSAALSTRRSLDAAVVAPLGILCGTFLARAVTVLAWGEMAGWLPDLLVAAAVSACIAAAIAWVLTKSPRLSRVLSLAAVLLVIAAGWYGATTQATTPAADGSTFVGMMSETPKLAPHSPDTALYLGYVQGLRAGQDYYHAAAAVLTESNRVRVGTIDLRTPLSFRLPTYYVALSWLPPEGIWLVLQALACMSLASAAAFVLARRFVTVPVALAGAAAVAAYYSSLAINDNLLNTELWAGALALLAAAFFASSHGEDGKRPAYVWAAAAAALAAALVRELAVAFVILGIAATLIDAEDRRRHLWVPWVGALGVTIAAYAAHISAARAVIRTLGSLPTMQAVPWLNPDGRGLLAAVDRIARLMGTQLPVAWILLAAAAIAALVVVRHRDVQVMLAGAVLGGSLVLLVFYPPGESSVTGLPPGYWGDIIGPTVLAAMPLLFALLPAARRVPALQATEEDAPSPAESEDASAAAGSGLGAA
jgi:hypothetical protein